MKLWDKGTNTDRSILHFTVGNDTALDEKLAKYDIIGSRAHAIMLQKVGLLTGEELDSILKVLDQLMASVEVGTFSIEPQLEDVHSKIEFELTRELSDTGKKIHTARSRNDQVLVMLHLYVKDELKAILSLVEELFNALIARAEETKHILMPGYTHTQIAMPSSFGLWFSAYAEILIDDVHMISAASRIADQNPLGSAAGYGSSFSIDRELTTELLGFSEMKVNSVAAQMARGKLEQSVGFGLASVAGTLIKMASDVCLFNSQNFGFIALPDKFTTGSSIMPHKKNPDVFELIRGKCNQVLNYPNEVALLTSNLTSGYHRDLQLLKEGLIVNIDKIKDCIELSIAMMKNIDVRDNIMEDPLYDQIFSVEIVNRYVQEGLPFRDAYRKVSSDIATGSYNPEKSVHHSHTGSIGSLHLEGIRDKMLSSLYDRRTSHHDT